MREIVFAFLVFGLLLSNLTLIYSLVRPERRFWPPPNHAPETWLRMAITKTNAILGPATMIEVLALGVLDWNSAAIFHASRYWIGGMLFGFAGIFAFWGSYSLGMRASMGNHEGLVASGAYRYSRNPQYVGTIVSVLGYAIFCNSTLTFIVWGLWTLWFLTAPFAEEHWMREKSGDRFEQYAAQVPRFLGLRKSPSENTN